MDRKKALDQLRIMQAWHEDNGNGPNADYDAICYAINIIEEMPEGTDTLIKALEKEHQRLLEMQKAQPEIIRCKDCENWDTTWENDWAKDYHYCPIIDGTRIGDWYCADAKRRTDE